MMNSQLDPAVGRFTQLTEEVQDEFRSCSTLSRNSTVSSSQVIPFADSDLEKLYTYAQVLATKHLTAPIQLSEPRRRSER